MDLTMENNVTSARTPNVHERHFIPSTPTMVASLKSKKASCNGQSMVLVFEQSPEDSK
jgi:hypothetical protein